MIITWQKNSLQSVLDAGCGDQVTFLLAPASGLFISISTFTASYFLVGQTSAADFMHLFVISLIVTEFSIREFYHQNYI